MLVRLVKRTDHRAPRNPDTGVLLGAEARDLGPADAPTAALLVHGFLGAGVNFGALPDRLAVQGYFVRVMRLPGHGTTPLDLVHTTADDLYQAVQTDLNNLKRRHQRVVMVGHSMGAALSTLAAAREGADGLVLGAPYFGITNRWYYAASPETWIRLSRPLAPWIYKGRHFVQIKRREVRRRVLSYKWIPRQASHALLEIGRQVNHQDTLDRVTCPVLLLHAPTDTAASATAAQRAFSKLASLQKKAIWLHHSNHHIFWDYDAELVIQETLAFLDNLPGPQNPNVLSSNPPP